MQARVSQGSMLQAQETEPDHPADRYFWSSLVYVLILKNK